MLLYIVLGLFLLFIIIMVATCIWLYRKIDATGKELFLFERDQNGLSVK